VIYGRNIDFKTKPKTNRQNAKITKNNSGTVIKTVKNTIQKLIAKTQKYRMETKRKDKVSVCVCE